MSFSLKFTNLLTYLVIFCEHGTRVMGGAQWEKTLKRAGNFNWWTYNSIEIKVGGIKINVIWGLYIPKTIRCIKIYF